MDMTMFSARPGRVEVVTIVKRRWRWTPEEKLRVALHWTVATDRSWAGRLPPRAFMRGWWVNWWGKPLRIDLEQVLRRKNPLNGLPTMAVAKQQPKHEALQSRWDLNRSRHGVTSPQSNGMAESFVTTIKRDFAKLANSSDSKTMMAQLQWWFVDYSS